MAHSSLPSRRSISLLTVLPLGAALAVGTCAALLAACGDGDGTGVVADGGLLDGTTNGNGDAAGDGATVDTDGSVVPADAEADGTTGDGATTSTDSGTSNDGGGTPTDGGTHADASADAASDVFVPCHSLVQRGAVIQETNVASPLPSFDPPGTIAAGAYKLTAVRVYTGVSGGTGTTGLTRQETLEIDPPSPISVSMLTVATETPAGDPPTTTYETRRLSFQNDGGVSVSELCAANFVGRTVYQSTGADAGAEFRIVLPPGSNRVLTYTKD
ncbi:MAG: hypothetical protein U0169_21390 [Polyangiaceae bacterium]